ncbi:hypothetical protein SAMN03097699_1496 [Flavobacteriaceae bacterium MAR_2010_188]|nr:hypothetical protein SAMN03097699_1496 [Flavobacteriaceae bacterium MAR_2010_188]
MLNKSLYTLFFICSIYLSSYSQTSTDSLVVEPRSAIEVDTIPNDIDPLSPAKAAFYSAVLPGLGQAYNKKYWKIPIVLGAIGTGIAIFDFNNKQLTRYRDAYKRRLAGFTDDEFYGEDADGNALITPKVTLDGLQRAQERARRNKDVSLLVTIGIYALNIVDANVDAHLLQYNVDENLSFRPHVKYNQLENMSDYGLTLNFNF